MSIVCDLERTNQLNLLPDKDLVDLCPHIEPYQVPKSQKNKKQKAEKEAKLEVLKRSIYSLLKNEEDLTEPQKIKLEAIKESGHPGYKETLIPQNCTQPILIEDSETGNNTLILSRELPPVPSVTRTLL